MIYCWNCYEHWKDDYKMKGQLIEAQCGDGCCHNWEWCTECEGTGMSKENNNLIVYNNPDFAEERSKVGYISLNKLEKIISLINSHIPEGTSENHLKLIQELVWSYENMAHACCVTGVDLDNILVFDCQEGYTEEEKAEGWGTCSYCSEEEGDCLCNTDDTERFHR